MNVIYDNLRDYNPRQFFERFQTVFEESVVNCNINKHYARTNEFYSVDEDVLETCGGWEHTTFTKNEKDIDRYLKWVEVEVTNNTKKWYKVEAWRETDTGDDDWEYFFDLYDSDGSLLGALTFNDENWFGDDFDEMEYRGLGEKVFLKAVESLGLCQETYYRCEVPATLDMCVDSFSTTEAASHGYW